jgi:hypothetical protein
MFLVSPSKYQLCPLEALATPQTRGDGLAFAYALKSTREVFPLGSLENGIFLEQYSKILPIVDSNGDSDDVVLGKWISGGVNIPVTSLRRITKLNVWLSVHELLEIIEVAGLPKPKDFGLIKRNSNKSDKMSSKSISAAKNKGSQKDSSATVSSSHKSNFVLPGRPQLESFFNEHIIDIILNREKYEKVGIEFPSAVILHGPPGCGKTFAVEKLVDYIGWPNFYIDSNTVGSPFIHETSKKVSELFDKAIDNAPSVIVIDEMESFLSERMHGNGTGQHHIEEVAEFLRRIPEAINKHVLIIAMTNMLEAIDPAIRRRGRFDHIIEVGMPSGEEVLSLLTSLLVKLPKAPNLNIEELVKILTGRALSDISFVVREASRLAVKGDKDVIDQACFEEALQLLPKLENNKRPIGFVN